MKPDTAQETVSVVVDVDVGGTFTDVVCRDANGRLRYFKVPTSRKDESIAILGSVQQVQRDWGIAADSIGRFAHDTTVGTNTVLERRGARMGLITTAGFKDVIEIERQLRHQMYDVILHPETPGFLAQGSWRMEVRERMDVNGNVVEPLDEEGLLDTVRELVDQGAEAIAICVLFSFVNPAHEQRAHDLIQQHYPQLFVATSHEVDPAFREYERTVVTSFDAYVKPLMTATSSAWKMVWWTAACAHPCR